MSLVTFLAVALNACALGLSWGQWLERRDRRSVVYGAFASACLVVVWFTR